MKRREIVEKLEKIKIVVGVIVGLVLFGEDDLEEDFELLEYDCKM